MPSANPPHDHYAQRIVDALLREPERVVIRTPDTAITAHDFLASVAGTAGALRRAGATPDDTVAIMTEPNSPALLAARYAAHLLGAAVTHIRSMNARSDRESLSRAAQADVLRRTGARFLAVDAADAARAEQLRGDVDGLTLVDVPSPGETPQAAHIPTAAPYAPDRPAVIDLTSGTGGEPKLVRRSFRARGAQIDLSAGAARPDRPLTLLAVTPISHATATMVDSVLAHGGTLVLHQDFDLTAVLHALTQQDVTDVYLAVPHLYQLLDEPGIERRHFPQLRQVLYSGTAAAPARIQQAADLFGGTLTQLYGSTEAGGICAMTPLDHQEPELLGSVGRPFPWVGIEIRDPDTGAEVPRGEVGEICVRSPTVMDGYVDDAALTRSVLRGDGMLRTGDLGHWDRYGYLHLVDRIGSIVKSHGLKLYPATIQRVLQSHPLVADAAVYGVRDSGYAEHVHAAVQLRTRPGPVDDQADPDVRNDLDARNDPDVLNDLKSYVAAALSDAHVPAALHLWPALPLNESGKPDLAILRNRKGAS
ncbi:class I adenylate-forming enzyme family protein [Streptomyces sp. NPDC059002]|uniref:class I adenylate-forming enzyme family protein n=1 Tax=Streptomyces sp. NPDC059002 TaxID=3346690 RepID=UPI0036C8F4A7